MNGLNIRFPVSLGVGGWAEVGVHGDLGTWGSAVRDKKTKQSENVLLNLKLKV